MQLLRGERIVHDAGTLKVTTHRIRFDHQNGGQGTIKSMMLEEVASCVLTRLTYPLLLVFAAFFVIVGVIASMRFSQNGYVIAGLLIGAILAICYLLSRRQVVAIQSAGATIAIQVNRWTLEEIRDFIDCVESAKDTRRSTMRRVRVVT